MGERNGSLSRGQVDLSKTTYRGLHLGVTYANWLLNGPMEIYGNTPGSPASTLTISRGSVAAAAAAALARQVSLPSSSSSDQQPVPD